MRTSTSDTDDVLVVEALTAESALEEVTAQLGPRAEIVEASKVLRGGIGGFFARELVQLTARRPEQTARERSFGEVLRAQLPPPQVDQPDALPRVAVPVPATASAPGLVAPAGATMTAEVAPPAASISDTAVAAPAAQAAPPQQPPWLGAPHWSAENLVRLGLPAAVIDPTRDLDPADDVAWVERIARAVAPLCRPLPQGDAALAGPGAARLARSLDVPVAAPPEPAPTAGTFAAGVGDSQRDRSWLSWNRGDRWLHLVLGGRATWRGLLFDEPLAVSWNGDRWLGDAVRCAAELGLVLGYGLRSGDGSRVERVRPLDVAMAVRDLVTPR